MTTGANVRDLLGPTPMNLAALVAFAACVGAGLSVGPQTLSYAAYLAAFSVWMAWFVAVFVRWLRRAEF